MALSLLSLLASLAFAQSGVVGTDKFGGLDDTSSPAAVAAHRCTNCLNVESNYDGTSIHKRGGYTQEAALTVATSPVSGSAIFTMSGGNNRIVVCHDIFCHSGLAGQTLTVFHSTASRSGGKGPSRWSFVNVNGYLYGANDHNDCVFQYDGTSRVCPSGIPNGSLLELTEDRLIVSGSTSAPNRLYFSRSGNYTDFTVGSLPADPWTDDIGIPGDKNTAIKYAAGRLYVFKRQSILSCILGDQYTTQCYPVTNSIGTVDPNSIVTAPGGIYFRGQEGTYWRLSDDVLEPISKSISNFVKSQNIGASFSYSMSSKAEWDSGTQSPYWVWDTTSVAGSIFTSSTSMTDTTGFDFASATFSVLISTLVEPGAITSAISTMTFPGAQNYSGWSLSVPTQTLACSGLVTDPVGSISYTVATPDPSCISGTVPSVVVQDVAGNTLKTDFSSQGIEGCTSHILSLSDVPDEHKYVKLVVNFGGTLATSPLGMRGDSIHYLHKSSRTASGGTCTNSFSIEASTSFFNGGTYTSRTYDTTFSTPVWGTFTVQNDPLYGSIGNTQSFQVQSSSSPSGTWSSFSSQNQASQITAPARRYMRYKITWANACATCTVDASNVVVNASSTGTYRSQCIQTANDISSWGILSCDQSLAGGGYINYYTTAAADCASLPATASTAWTATTNNALIATGLKPAMAVGFISSLGAGTDTAKVNSCLVNWNTGTQSQPTFGLYDSNGNSIYWTSTINNASTSNRMLKYDLNLGEWYPFDLPAAALLLSDNRFYFGGASGGTWNRYNAPAVDSDNGSAINSYWKSKGWNCGDPFREADWLKASAVVANKQGGALTETWTTSLGQTGTYSVSMSTVAGLAYVRANHYLPKSSPAQFMSLQYGNNAADQPWEVLGFRLDCFQKPWLPANP